MASVTEENKIGMEGNGFGESSKKHLEEQLDILDQLLKPEVQESLSILVGNLPKLADMTTLMTKYYDLFETIKNDRVLQADFVEGIQEFIKPVEGKVKEVAASAIEANDRAQLETTTIGLFGLIKMLKDPQVQKLFRFVQAYLDITATKTNEK